MIQEILTLATLHGIDSAAPLFGATFHADARGSDFVCGTLTLEDGQSFPVSYTECGAWELGWI